MNILENKMIDILTDLKENYHVLGVKAEFETEGTSFEEAKKLKEIITKTGLELTIKIGGSEAIRDMFDAKDIGVNTLVEPMIETPYAMKKYINAIKSVFSEEERKNIKFLINIETITGYNNLDNIINSKDFSELAGVVIGRGDMIGSMELTKKEVNSDKIFTIANSIADKMLRTNKELIIGGGVDVDSIPFFKKLLQNYLTQFETRKIIFDAPKALTNPNIDKGIIKAIEFELMWLKNKREFYKIIWKKDTQRIKMLENLYKKFIEKTGEKYV